MKISKNDLELFAQLLDKSEQSGKIFKSKKAYMEFTDDMIELFDSVFDNFDRYKFEWRLFGI